MRKYPLVTGEVYHVMNKSIEGYEIFPRPEDYQRMLRLLRYFTLTTPPTKFSFFLERNPDVKHDGFEATVAAEAKANGQGVEVISYCLMPTHIHLVLKQTRPNGITFLLRKSLLSYARYFNTKYKRHGALWMSRFKNVIVESDEQLLHLTRYLHLNPVTAHLVARAEDWHYSSYPEFVSREHVPYPLSVDTSELINITPESYERFVSDHAAYQQKLALIKHLALD